MKCPIDGATLLMSDKKDVEIDYCPECRGVWLDRGELEKLISKDDDRTAGNPLPPSEVREYEQGHKQHGDYHMGNKKKKSSFLGEIFDF